MCGILGYIGQIDRVRFKRALDKISHRGPDSEGVYVSDDQHINLGHRRLSILDLSEHANQPMLSKRGVVLIFNGEIYNYLELKKDLIGRGYSFETTSDTEVVLNAYLEHGPSSFTLFNGIFALAIYDPMKDLVLLARDPLGVKPLYYSQDGKNFIFGSELKSLLDLRTRTFHWNKQALVEYLMYLYTPSPRTLIDGVQKLNPGECIQLKRGVIIDQRVFLSVRSFVKPSLELQNKTQDSLYDMFYRAVKRQLISDVPVGAFLSGGVDSTAICSVMKQELRDKNLPCFTINFKSEDGFDGFALDYPYARRFADESGLTLHTVDTTPDALLSRLDHMIYHMDEPCPDPAALNVDLICELARKQGIKVLLSGSGGDDLFSGYRRHLLSQIDPLRYMPGSMQRLLRWSLMRWPSETAWMRRIRRYLNTQSKEGDERLMEFFAWHPFEQIQSILNPEFISQSDCQPEEFSFAKSLKELSTGLSPLRKMLYLEQKYFLADHNLNYMDKMGMAHGVEIRVPFLDLDLVDFSWSIPDRQLIQGKELKYLFKKSMHGIVPDYILKRPKSGFGAPLRKWIRHDLKSELDDQLNDSDLKAWGIFDPVAVKRLITQDRSGKMDASYLLFAILILKKWEQKFFNG